MATIREKKLALRESMNILRAGTTIATVRKARFTPFRNRFTIDVEGDQDIVAQGDILHHEYDSAAETMRSPAYRSTGWR